MEVNKRFLKFFFAKMLLLKFFVSIAISDFHDNRHSLLTSQAHKLISLLKKGYYTASDY